MDTVPAFYDDHFHALRAAIEGGKGYKATAARLWPSMKPESAYARLKDCTKHDGDHKLDLSDVRVVCEFNQRFDPLYFLCDETHHERPRQRNAIDEAKSLVDFLKELSTQQSAVMCRLEVLAKHNPAILKQVA